MVTKLVKTDAVSSPASLIQYQEGVVSQLHFKQVPRYVSFDAPGLRPHLEKSPRLPETDFLKLWLMERDCSQGIDFSFLTMGNAKRAHDTQLLLLGLLQYVRPHSEYPTIMLPVIQVLCTKPFKSVINSIQLFHFTQGNRNSIVVLTSYKHYHVANSSPFIQGSALSAPLRTGRFGTGVSVKTTWLVLCERSFRADTKHGFVLVPFFFSCKLQCWCCFLLFSSSLSKNAYQSLPS